MRTKKRKLRKISAAERVAIVKMVAQGELSHEEIALQFNVKKQLICDLMSSLKRSKALFIHKRKSELDKEKKYSLIDGAIKSKLNQNASIWSVNEIIK